MNDILPNVSGITDEERNLIKGNIPWEKDIWYDTKFSIIKSKIKKYLYKEIKEKCAYCQTQIDDGTAIPEVEHIAPQSKYPKFTFAAKNLTIACHNCNKAKLASEVFYEPNLHIDTDYQLYPIDTASFKIVHANIDQYEEHIEIYKGLFYKPRYKDNIVSEKGANTIEMCQLYRIRLIEERAMKIIANESCDYFNKEKEPIPSVIELIGDDIGIIQKSNEIVTNYTELSNKIKELGQACIDAKSVENNKVLDFRILLEKKAEYKSLLNEVKSEDIEKYCSIIGSLRDLKQIVEVVKVFNRKRSLKELVGSKLGVDTKNIFDIISKAFRPALEVISKPNIELIETYSNLNIFLKEPDKMIQLTHISILENLITSIEKINNVHKLIIKMPIEITRFLDGIGDDEIKAFESVGQELRNNVLLDKVIQLKEIRKIESGKKTDISELHKIISYIN